MMSEWLDKILEALTGFEVVLTVDDPQSPNEIRFRLRRQKDE